MPRVSSLSPVTIIIPLVTVLFLTAVKDAIEDYVCLFLPCDACSEKHGIAVVSWASVRLSVTVCVVQHASQRPAAAQCTALCLLQHGAWWSIVMNIYPQAGLTVGI